MIISASRRTDIPAFHADEFMQCIRQGWIDVANPFNPASVARVSLLPENVDVIVFWTRNADPLIPHLNELDNRGFKYMFLYTLTGYPRELEPNCPSVSQAVGTIRTLSDMIGKDRVVWRYDPIFVSQITPLEYHSLNFKRIADQLNGYCSRVIISLFDPYRSAMKRIRKLIPDLSIMELPQEDPAFPGLIMQIQNTCRECNMDLASCCENLLDYGISPGACIDAVLLQNIFGIDLDTRKDTGQRSECRCIRSRDIGTYGTCRHGCIYCYASSNRRMPEKNQSHCTEHL